MKENTVLLIDVSIKLFIFFLAVYLLTASIYSYYFADVSQARIEVVKSIVERYDLSVPPEIGMTGADGRSYSWFGIGSALVAVPFYLAGKFLNVAPQVVITIIPQIVVSVTGVLVFLFSRSLGYSMRSSLFPPFSMALPLWHGITLKTREIMH